MWRLEEKEYFDDFGSSKITNLLRLYSLITAGRNHLGIHCLGFYLQSRLEDVKSFLWFINQELTNNKQLETEMRIDRKIDR